MTSDIIFSENTGKTTIGLITLNKPQTLNALTQDMVMAMDKQLAEWAVAPQIKAVVIRSASEKAFCAGGDIRQIYTMGKRNPAAAKVFFWHEYRLNHRIFHYPKPYIAFLDGITMGGGVGISIHGSHRVATERLIFAMPETGIGLFPDVGGSYFLSRCPGKIGFYLGLTGARINSAETIYAGLADYVINSHQVEEIITSLVNTPFSTDSHAAVTEILQSFSKAPGEASLIQQREAIDSCFAGTSITDIISRLKIRNDDWSRQTIKSLATKSPTSLAITLQQLQKGAQLDLDNCLKMEYRLVNRVLEGHDIFEGVRAVIIDKDQNPRWQPGSLATIQEKDIQIYFMSLGDSELQFN